MKENEDEVKNAIDIKFTEEKKADTDTDTDTDPDEIAIDFWWSDVQEKYEENIVSANDIESLQSILMSKFFLIN